MRSVTRFGLCAALGLALSGAAQPAQEVAGAEAPSEAAEARPPAVEEPQAETANAFDKAFASEPAPETSATPAPEAAPAAAPPKLAKGAPVTREFLVGIWAEPGKSCEAGIDFQADGRMIGPFPRWELEDGQLTMVGNRQKMRLTVVDKDTIQSRRSDTDPPRTLKRCAKAPPPPTP